MASLRRSHWSCRMNDEEHHWGKHPRIWGKNILAKRRAKVTERSLWWFGARKMAGSLGQMGRGRADWQGQIMKGLWVMVMINGSHWRVSIGEPCHQNYS